MGVRPLTAREIDELRDWRAVGAYMAEYYGFDEEVTPEFLDRLLVAWRRDPRAKARSSVVARAMGTMLGDILTRHLCCAWGMVEDVRGQDLCVAPETTGWEVTPISYVRKRVTTWNSNADERLFARAWRMFRDIIPARTVPLDP